MMSDVILLTELFQKASLQIPASPSMQVIVHNIVSDSRQVQPGSLFVALKGTSNDGHRFIPDAIQRGAVAIVGTKPLTKLDVPYVQVQDSHEALAYLAAAYYHYPARKLTVIGITGTEGKTTTANFIFQIMKAAGLQTGMISSVDAVIGEQVLDTGFHVTTPDAPDVQRYLAMMVAKGMTHIILEATSHGLAQKRVEACEFDIAVITNITHEHLDYHGSMDAYRASKARLFTSLEKTVSKPQGNPRLAVLNRDDNSFKHLSGLTSATKISYGKHPDADIRPQEISSDPGGLHFWVEGPGFHFAVESSLIGEYNISNILAAVSTTAVGLQLEPQVVQRGIKALTAIPGRMERIALGQDFMAIVDFAHTPNSLRWTLETARQLTRGRVIALFGSAGLRDHLKRRMMAEISARFADLTILTAEDPRTESLEDILREMAAGAQAQGGIENQTFWRIPDRREAMRFGARQAKPGDVVIACGKGHEQSMCFGTIEYPWDDRVAMRAALSELLSIPGPAMPFLPDQI
jgi:UDP-N-acetylmuramoyl-L-alanyl-D-glutamate--2,6-diaminopimelate ligase